jgi:hypothetical protein
MNTPSTTSPTPIISATLAAQSPHMNNPVHMPLSRLQECTLVSHTPFELDYQSNGLAEIFSSYLATSPRPLAGLGFRYMDSMCLYTPDFLSTQECPLMDTQAPSAGSNNFLHFGVCAPPPLCESVGCFMDLKEAESTLLTYPEIYTSRQWSPGRPPPQDVFDVYSFFSMDGELPTLPETQDSPLLHDLFREPSNLTPPMMPPIPDINMFALALSRQAPSVGVNPAETMIVADSDGWMHGDPDSPFPPSSSSPSSQSPFQSPDSNVLSVEVMDEILSIMSAYVAAGSAAPDESNGEIEDGIAPVTVPQSTPLPSSPILQNLAYPPVLGPREVPTNEFIPENSTKMPQRKPVKLPENDHMPIMGTPVLDAHHGIHLADLRAKAERYRQRNPGQEIDKRWLNSFAGKLSDRGELLEDFRCYVIGCFQTNKRRDHILIHVGSHVNQRPFLCGHW